MIKIRKSYLNPGWKRLKTTEDDILENEGSRELRKSLTKSDFLMSQAAFNVKEESLGGQPRAVCVRLDRSRTIARLYSFEICQSQFQSGLKLWLGFSQSKCCK